ncbi:MAG: hypothetical protein J7545_12935 [Roseofilum sp. SBFL]|uniref:hypothetical protein n=1 Tax=unclassified Roseofilum TaxID=2620099 RepID=UPI001B23946D|nr:MULTISPECIES: hypothetical protein [unclassified Roseofilum]MBP0013738.1 hypothetical protein [Roseofilum sp. SID3]MBP0024130.1 hypothetical protein [Roseofilum sp. SID2]MBP0035512.1 hypothetical protein [Roseofilum sp. Belize BBD 4]MBP0037526.1 hypothetical protein [Roseofilum sp. SID1]MBP0042857.1 hypothetical protein [Roseofilum sp. SBFL]
MADAMPTREGVFLCSRDLDVTGNRVFNHHFLLIVSSNDYLKSLGCDTKANYLTISGIESDGRLKLVYNYGLDTDACTKGERDFQCKPVRCPDGCDYKGFIKRLVDQAECYVKNSAAHKVSYVFYKQNCATFTTSMLVHAGIPYPEVVKLADFRGWDVGEDKCMEEWLFR